MNKQLETRNEGLILEIENIEREKAELEEKANRNSTRHNYGNRKNFDTSFLDE